MSIKPHAFVAMPFGTKPGPDGELVDFNRVYAELIRPALEQAGMHAFRADEETRPGDIRADMFQELLIADLVVVDVSIDNPNVWYELGVRHALRARGVVLISGGHSTKAFDIYTDRKLRYALREGGPDPLTLDEDRGKLRDMVVATMESWHGRTMSPVYHLIPNLPEPDWRSLRVGNLREFWDVYEAWERRLIQARRRGRVGDMLVLADEAPVAAFRANAWIRAGKALRRLGHYAFALEQLDKGLAIEPRNLDGLREKGLCLQRLALGGAFGSDLNKARDHYLQTLQIEPDDAETWALLGRVEKDAWISAWRLPGSSVADRLKDARYEDALLRASIDAYETAFRLDLKHYYSGVNALTLMHLHTHLTGDQRYAGRMESMAGAVRYSAACAHNEDEPYWPAATLGDLEVITGAPDTTEAAYKEATAVNRGNWFSLDSTREQLLLLRELGMATANVEAGLGVIDRALRRQPRLAQDWTPRRVILFSGHMVDTPDRPVARFPESKVAAAADAIQATLDRIGVGAEDLALTQGACGGDLLFTEICQSLGARVAWMQPLREGEFIQSAVVRGGEHWRQRYLDAKQNVQKPIECAFDELGDPPAYTNRPYLYERCNRWQLYTALAWGIEKVYFVCLWDGAGGDGPGGTADMYQEVAKRTGHVYWIDIREI